MIGFTLPFLKFPSSIVLVSTEGGSPGPAAKRGRTLSQADSQME
jgi:hypothetical protein